MQEGKEHPRISELKGSWRHCNKAHIAHRYGSRFGGQGGSKRHVGLALPGVSVWAGEIDVNYPKPHMESPETDDNLGEVSTIPCIAKRLVSVIKST